MHTVEKSLEVIPSCVEIFDDLARLESNQALSTSITWAYVVSETCRARQTN